ncbi:DICT sensory domain-containing protein [Micromonospora rosaria]|uniref:DICT sensory domain-containing protein n=1 Tax=Micromonospora rosaria TaxID=47874 RepID=UPI000A891EF4|nr:DICT sensory domain-containing protein [Micromonospora rosaria]
MVLHSGPVSERLTKRSLVTVSHAIERAALASAEDGPLVVFALFQRLPYFGRERRRYERIAARAAATVVGLVGADPVLPPPGAYGVALDGDEELAREWSVVALTPRFGGVLVARDLAEVAPEATTLESGRLFEGRWSFRRDEALHEVLRLRDRLANRLPVAARDAVDETVGRVRDLPATPGEARVEAAMRLLAGRAEQAYRAALTRPEVADEPTRLLDETGLAHWAGAGGVTASGVLPVALVGVRVEDRAGSPGGVARRGAAREAQAVLGALTGPLGPADRAVRLAEREFLLVLPALTEEQAVAAAHRVHESMAGLASSYPFVTFTVHTVVAVTARRPLPVADVREALRWAVREGVPVATVAAAPAPVATAGR